MKLTWLLTFVLTLSGPFAFAQNIQFYREDLQFTLTKEHITVEGYYYFCNTSGGNGRFILFYPFPEDKKYGTVDSVEVLAMPELKEIHFNRSGNGITFPVQVDPYNAKKIRVKYRQKISGHKAEYILMTTQQWKRPLELAHYTLIVPNEIQVDSLSFSPDTTFVKNNSTLYTWYKRDFLPDRNMKFFFHDNSNKKGYRKK